MMRGLAASLLLGMVVVAHAAGHGVVLVYHHVSNRTPAPTSVSPQRFEQHLDYLQNHGFRVWPLQRLLASAIAGVEPIPDNVVAITFDDAYASVYSEAWPRLAERGWPFTVFVATDPIDAGLEPYMSWEEIRELAAAGVAIENHSASHTHLPRRLEGESKPAWKKRVREDIHRAHMRIAEQTGRAPQLFAWPYGEYTTTLAALVAEHYEYALAQHSGAAGKRTDPMAVPRFPLAAGFDSLERLALAVNARPLPVIHANIKPPPVNGVVNDPHVLELELAGENGYRPAQLNCFTATGEPLAATMAPEAPHRLRVDIAGSGSPGRNKVNCTAPAADGSGHFFWYSFQWLQQQAGGGWPAE